MQIYVCVKHVPNSGALIELDREKALLAANVETLNGYNVKNVLTTCPHTYNVSQNEYPQFNCTMQVWHHTEYLDHLLSTARLILPKTDTIKDLYIS